MVIEVARAGEWRPIAAVDPGVQGEVLGVPVYRHDDDDVAKLWAARRFDAVVVAIGDNRLRQKLAERMRDIGCPTPAIIHPAAIISPTARIDGGVGVMAGAIINANAHIGQDSIVNTGAIVEHDCVLGVAVHAAPRSVLAGSCVVGARALLGVGSVARPGTRIGADAIVGAGSAVVSNIADGWVAGGAPARRIR